MKYEVERQIDHLKIASNVEIASTVYTRMMGLMFSKDMGEKDGLLIEPCNSIHTFFMKYPIDVIFMSRTNEVVKIIRNIKPWRVTWVYFSAHKVLEMMGNSLSNEIKEGDQLEVRCIN